MKTPQKTIADQPSWVIRSDSVELAITQLGGHMSPVTFYRSSGKPVQPYYVNPWHGEKLAMPAPVLEPLRGDFFCMPFGDNGPYRGQMVAPHGDSACRKWTLHEVAHRGDMTVITMIMRTAAPEGTIVKSLGLIDGQNVVYCRNVLAGYSVSAPLGHHATLAAPGGEGSLQIVTSPMKFGMTNPGGSGDPADGEYSCLAPGARFTNLAAVPTILKDPATADCSAFPLRKGFVDILAMFNKPTIGPAWVTATAADEGYVWFSLKDAPVLPTTMMWMENHGRHGVPWNGRNCCVGLEDVCAFFAKGIGPSNAPNAVAKAGVPTVMKLTPKKPTVINYIQGVVKVPRDFKKIKTLTFAPGEVTFVSVTGKKVTTPVNHEFLYLAQ